MLKDFRALCLGPQQASLPCHASQGSHDDWQSRRCCSLYVDGCAVNPVIHLQSKPSMRYRAAAAGRGAQGDGPADAQPAQGRRRVVVRLLNPCLLNALPSSAGLTKAPQESARRADDALPFELA